jgi:hypothetical protein
MEHSFDIITYEHVIRRSNELDDAYTNYILDWNLHHQ